MLMWFPELRGPARMRSKALDASVLAGLAIADSKRRSAMSHSKTKSGNSPPTPWGCAPPVRSRRILMAGSGPGATVTHAESSCATYLPGRRKRKGGRSSARNDILKWTSMRATWGSSALRTAARQASVAGKAAGAACRQVWRGRGALTRPSAARSACA
eukprot:scaffold2507_cov122-Isochrysis_galbana.AAC.16